MPLTKDSIENRFRQLGERYSNLRSEADATDPEDEHENLVDALDDLEQAFTDLETQIEDLQAGDEDEDEEDEDE